MNHKILPKVIAVVLAAPLIFLAGCETTLSQQHMRQANALIKEAGARSQAGDFSGAEAAAVTLGNEVRSGVVAAVKDGTSRFGSEGLANLLKAWEHGAYPAWRDALRAENEGKSDAMLSAVRGQCMSCHSSIGRPKIVVAGG